MLDDVGYMLNGAACAVFRLPPEEVGAFGFDETEIRDLKGPLTRVLNKRAQQWPAVGRAVAASDELFVTMKLGRWVIDSGSDVIAQRRYRSVLAEEAHNDEVAREAPPVPPEESV